MSDAQRRVITPGWVRDAVFYQIFPDRFAKSDKLRKPNNLETWDSPPTPHGFKGGDLIGVVEHLDYLVDLGIDAIYFNPVFQSAANHRYHTYDYFKVDSILGGNEALQVLIDAAHEHGIKIIIDGVFNHASRGFFQFHDIMENGPHSPYIDWFTVRGWPLRAYDTNEPPNYDAWWQLHALPKFNVYNADVRKYLLDAGEHWIRFGVDGWRLDVPSEIPDDSFWQEFRRRVKGANPEAYIVGEIWEEARHWLQGDQFDAVMNYLFTKLCMEYFIGGDVSPELVQGSSLWPLSSRTAVDFARGIDGLLGLYTPEVTGVQLNLLDSHDTARFLTIANGDENALRLAALFQMVYPGAPCVYYGDEVGMTGGRDPFSRGSFSWDDGKWNKSLREYYKRIIALRRSHPALRRGEYLTLYASGMVYAMGRRLDDDRVAVVFNAGRDAVSVTLPTVQLFPEASELDEIFSAQKYSPKDGSVTIQLPGRSAQVLVSAQPVRAETVAVTSAAAG